MPAMPAPTNTTDRADIALPAEWRAGMKRSREARNLTQGQLGAMVGLTQAAISQIENGVAKSSQHVLKISAALGIDPPSFIDDELVREWQRLGARLRREDPDAFALVLNLARNYVGRLSDSGADQEKH